MNFFIPTSIWKMNDGALLGCTMATNRSAVLSFLDGKRINQSFTVDQGADGFRLRQQSPHPLYWLQFSNGEEYFYARSLGLSTALYERAMAKDHLSTIRTNYGNGWTDVPIGEYLRISWLLVNHPQKLPRTDPIALERLSSEINRHTATLLDSFSGVDDHDIALMLLRNDMTEYVRWGADATGI